jgi:putative serine protease PepD
VLDEPPTPPAPRRRALRLAAPLAPAVVGALVAVGVIAATGNLGGGEGTTVTRVVREPVAVTSPPPAAARDRPADAAAGGGLSVQEIVRQATPAIVSVSVVTDEGEQQGSGFLIDRAGHVLTNAHVVTGGEDDVSLRFQDRRETPAEVLGVDESTDLAVLEAKSVSEAAGVLPLGTSKGLAVGDPVLAIGNPLGLEGTATTGIVSALKREIFAPNDFPIHNVIQTDAAINHGNSGGPLLDAGGRVIGINSQIATESGGNDGIGFAIPIDTVRPVAESIMATGRAEHAWIGIVGQALTPELADALGEPGRKGVAVRELDDRGPAKAAGMKAAPGGEDVEVPRGGDLIVAVNGAPVEDMADVSAAVASRRVGERLTVTVLRDGRRVDLEMTLADRPADLERVQP